MIRNLGIMFVIALGMSVFLFLLLLMSKIARKSELVKKQYEELKKKVFYNMFVRYILQSALKIQIASWTTIGLISWSSFSEVFQGISAYLLVTIFFASPYVFLSVIAANDSNLGS